MTYAASKRNQTGVTIPEATMVVLVAAIMGAAATKGVRYAVRDNTASNVAMQIANGYDILNNYVASNVDAIITGASVPGVANPLSPTEAELHALGYRSFSTRSTLSSINYAYSLTLEPVGCSPNTCNVAVYYGMNKAPRSEDNAVDMALVVNIANRIGRPAGFSPLTAPGNILGLGGSFNIANPTGAEPGIVAAYGSYGAGQFGNYVRLGDTRDVPLSGKLSVAGSVRTNGGVTADGDITAGNALKSMGPTSVGTTLAVAGGNMIVDSAGSIQSRGHVQASGPVDASGGLIARNGKVWIAPTEMAAGSPCTDDTGTITTDSGGRLLSCQRGTWHAASGRPTFTVVQCGQAIVGCPAGSQQLFRFSSLAGLSNCEYQVHTVCQAD